MTPAPQLIIAGGGLSGSLAALALAERRPDVSFLLIEQGQSFGGNHVWSFFDSDVAPEQRWLVDPLVTGRWPDHEVSFPKRSRRIALGYNSITSECLDRLVRRRLRPDQYQLGQRIVDLGDHHLTLDGGERIEARGIIDARGVSALEGLDLGWQKFVGRTYRFERAHRSSRPVIMDACVDQQGGYRFVYTLPFSENELMVEDTYYSTSAVLDATRVGEKIEDYVLNKGWGAGQVVSEEIGILPVLLGGEVATLWDRSGPPIARLGLRGGFFHPTTGYTMPDAVQNAALLAQQRDLSGPALHLFYHRRAAALWKERSFYKLLNRMLFRAAGPHERYRVLEHFYRLPQTLIARFYAGQLTTWDKLRIVSGRPPVPLRRALAALRERNA